MATYTKEQIENVWFALNLNRLIPNNEAYSGAGLHNPNRSINMYKWLQDALTLIGVGPVTLPLNTKGDILTYTTTLAKLGVGSNGQVLTADSSTATGLKWETLSIPPGYIPPVTTKGDIFTFDTLPNRLPVGTNNQVLTVDSSTATGLKWATPSGGYTSPLTTKGDIFVRGASDTRLPVGTNGQFLSADSSEATGLKWVAAPGGGGTNIYNTNGSLSSNRIVNLNNNTLAFTQYRSFTSPYTGWIQSNLGITEQGLSCNNQVDNSSSGTYTAFMNVITNISSPTKAHVSLYTKFDTAFSGLDSITESTTTSHTSLFSQVDSLIARIICGAEVSGEVFSEFAIPTFTNKDDYHGLKYMSPVDVPKRASIHTISSNETVKAYPLERRDFYFADSMQGTTVLNAYSKTGLTTDSDGASRRIVKVTMSCTGNAGTSGADSIEITLYRHDNSVVYTALIATPPVSAGKIFEADLSSAPISLSANSTYYAKVTALSGVSSATRGLTLTVYTI